MAEEQKKTKQVTLLRGVRQVVDGKMQKLEAGQVVDLPYLDANILISGNKAAAGKVDVPKREKRHLAKTADTKK